MSEHRTIVLKKIIERLHAGEDPDTIKEEFREVLATTSSTEIAQAEEELIKEGVPREEIQELCDIHLAIFKESLERQKHIAPDGHPIHVQMAEHEIIIGVATELYSLTAAISKGDREPDSSTLSRIRELVRYFRGSTTHYQREENVIFPILEKHGITGPPSIMWNEHDQIRGAEKALYEVVSDVDEDLVGNIRKIENIARGLSELLSGHFYKENNILFPTAMRLFSEEEWATTARGFEDIGYCFFTPEKAQIVGGSSAQGVAEISSDGMVSLESGSMSVHMLQTMLNTLPVDITVVDDDDKVVYFSESPDRVFVRTRAIVGRSVQLCHPKESVHIVNRILDDFRNKKRDVAEFWLSLNSRMIHIRYFAMRDVNGKYMGCLEVSQDITEIRKIEGEKRLLSEA